MKHNTYNMLYTHDGNKNVSEVMFANPINGIGAHYEYAPFGAITRASKSTPISTVDFIELNPFRFSSEFHDQELGLVYYNYRHYSPTDGRWLSRDPIEEQGGLNLYGFTRNHMLNIIDILGTAEDGGWLLSNIQRLFNNGGGENLSVGQGIVMLNPAGVASIPIHSSIQLYSEANEPEGPGIKDQINIFGLRGREGHENYTKWFEYRFPNSVKGARELLITRIIEKICKLSKYGMRPQTVAGLIDKENDVDISPSMSRYKDIPQGFWEKNVRIGAFEFKSDNISIKWIGSNKFSFTATMYVLEQTGANNPFTTGNKCSGDWLYFTGLFVNREVRMGEWKIEGQGCCDEK